MKRSEKLLDAIGQIDDRLVEEAARAGKERQEGKKYRKKTLYRWQGALAACALIAVCVGIFGILKQSGMIFGPYGEKAADTAEMALEDSGVSMAVQVEADPTAGPEAAVTSNDEAAAPNAGEMPEAEIEPYAQAAEEKEPKPELAAAEAVPEALSENADQSRMAAAGNQDQNPAAKEAGLSQSESIADGGLTLADGSDQVTVSVKEISAERVTFILENRGDESICYGEAYELERLLGESWEKVQPKKVLIWNDGGYETKPGGSNEVVVNIGSAYGKLEPGQYRIVKEYWLESNAGTADYEKYPVYAEFAVAD